MKKIINVPYIDQTEEWPTGCESVSAVMLLQYLGVDISVNEFIETYLERKPFVEKDGKIYGPDPRKYFAGSPYDTESMGCYAPVIEKTLNKVMDAVRNGKHPLRENAFLAAMKKENMADGWCAKDITGMPLSDMLHQYIDNDMPVVFWACIDLKEAIIGPEWIVDETGEVFTWRSNEHCMLFVGYDEKYYYFNDPWHNHGTIGYEKDLVEKRHKEQYEMAVTITKM